MRVGPLEGGLPDSAPGPVEWLSRLGGCLFWAWDGFSGHVYIFAYMCAGCVCVYLYAYMLRLMCVLVCIYVNSKKKCM